MVFESMRIFRQTASAFRDRGDLATPRGFARGRQIVEDSAVLLRERRDDGHHRFDKPRPSANKKRPDPRCSAIDSPLPYLKAVTHAPSGVKKHFAVAI